MMCFDQWEGELGTPPDPKFERALLDLFRLVQAARPNTLWIVRVEAEAGDGLGYDTFTRFAWNEDDLRECVAEFGREFTGVKPTIRKFTSVTVTSMRIGNGADRDTTGG